MRDSIGPSGATGPRGVKAYQMTVMASGLRLYARTGLRPNRAYTPSAMVRTARALLSPEVPKLGARDYFGWADALTAAVAAGKVTRHTKHSAARAPGFYRLAA